MATGYWCAMSEGYILKKCDLKDCDGKKTRCNDTCKINGLEDIKLIQETQEHISNVGRFMSEIIAELVLRASKHDMSKLGDETEHNIFLEYTAKLKTTTYGSPEYSRYLQEMKEGLKHHYSNNLHHPEHNVDGIRGMSLVDLIEMICDWKAATMRHNDGNIILSIEKNQERFGYSDELKQIFLNTITIFEKEKGVESNGK